MEKLATIKRPRPPQLLLDSSAADDFFSPAPEVRDWFNEVFVFEGARLRNPDHAHLQMADIGVVWTSVRCSRQMLPVAGMMELTRPNPMQSAWAKARHRAQLRDWFGRIPDFLMTLYAPYLAGVDNATFCAVVEHELYHGALKHITRRGMPVWGIRGHDVEEHVGVVARYGVGAAAGRTKDLVEVARRRPLVAPAQITAVCGTCLRLAA